MTPKQLQIIVSVLIGISLILLAYNLLEGIISLS